MHIYEYGDPQAENVLLQPVGDHDLPMLESEVAEIRRRTDQLFRLLAVKVEDWNRDLSPWCAPAVFGNADFSGGAPELLECLLPLCADTSRRYLIGGYSMAGLFALWASCRSDIFAGTAAASPSVWFPGFTDEMKKCGVKSSAVYLSLGDREEKTRNAVMASVGDQIRSLSAWLKDSGVCSVLEWNAGGHFKEPDMRTAKAFAWVLEHSRATQTASVCSR